MLAAIGVGSLQEIFERQIPESVRLGRELDLPDGLAEQDVYEHLRALAARNTSVEDELSFLGAGMYDHYVPALIDMLMERSEFLTPYTPYQPEISQGGLQVMFEYQTAISELTALPVSNASVYEGPSAVAAAAYLAKLHNGRQRIVASAGLHPHTLQTLRTNAHGFGMEVIEVPLRDGITDPDAWAAAIDADTTGSARPTVAPASAAIFAQPNFYGVVEDADALSWQQRPPRPPVRILAERRLGRPGAGRHRAGRSDHARHPQAARRVRRRRGRRRGSVARQPPGLRRSVLRPVRRARGVLAADARTHRR